MGVHSVLLQARKESTIFLIVTYTSFEIKLQFNCDVERVNSRLNSFIMRTGFYMAENTKWGYENLS